MPSKTINLRLDVEEHAAWSAKATGEGMSLSAWIREACTYRLEEHPSLQEQEASEPAQPAIAKPTVAMAPSKPAIPSQGPLPYVGPVYAAPAPAPTRTRCKACGRTLFNGERCLACAASPS